MCVEHLWHVPDQELNVNCVPMDRSEGQPGDLGDYLSSLLSIADRQLYKIYGPRGFHYSEIYREIL